ncbi:MAG: hypothetical protein J6A59_18305 [Lachnospiraceae bacterium]|nr:hypothetical protein [Lachnospiraceae bacterium]
MKKLRKQYIIAVIIVVISFLLGVYVHSIFVNKNANTNSIEAVDTNINECIHKWRVLDRGNSSAILVTCESCGELVLVDYNNYRMRADYTGKR